MKNFERITFDPNIMGGKPCIRGLRVTVSAIIGLLASGLTSDDILKLYPYLQHEDVLVALSYAAHKCEELETPTTKADIISHIKQAVIELNLVLAGKLEARDADDVMKEL